jgi:hypothetical protein
LNSSRRPSHRRDRERGYRDSDLEAEDDNVDDEREARFSASSQLKKSAELCPPTSVNGKGATKATDPGLCRNFKSYAVGTKLGTYDGSTSLETFLARFENCAEYFEWTDATSCINYGPVWKGRPVNYFGVHRKVQRLT